MSIQSGLGLAAGTVVLILYLRSQQKEIAMLMGICAGLILFLAAARKISEAMQAILHLTSAGWIGETGEILLKSLGIAYAAQITADICREAGETAMGSQIELLAKAEIVLLCLPLARQIFSVAESLLS